MSPEEIPEDMAASYLEKIVNEYARQGWEFYRVDSIGIRDMPGLFARLFGQRPFDRIFYVITFRRHAS